MANFAEQVLLVSELLGKQQKLGISVRPGLCLVFYSDRPPVNFRAITIFEAATSLHPALSGGFAAQYSTAYTGHLHNKIALPVWQEKVGVVADNLRYSWQRNA